MEHGIEARTLVFVRGVSAAAEPDGRDQRARSKANGSGWRDQRHGVAFWAAHPPNRSHISRRAIKSPAPPKAAPFVPLTIARMRRRYYARGSVTFQDKCGQPMAAPSPPSTGRPRGPGPDCFTWINCGNEDEPERGRNTTQEMLF